MRKNISGLVSGSVCADYTHKIFFLNKFSSDKIIAWSLRQSKNICSQYVLEICTTGRLDDQFNTKYYIPHTYINGGIRLKQNHGTDSAHKIIQL